MSKLTPATDFYTWTRDSALTLKMIVDEYVLGKSDLEQYVDDYLRAQAVLQTITSPSGTFLPSGAGLGEPKYNVDGSRFNGAVRFGSRPCPCPYSARTNLISDC